MVTTIEQVRVNRRLPVRVSYHPAWMRHGRCAAHLASGGDDLWHTPDVEPAEQRTAYTARVNAAREACIACPVRLLCLNEGMRPENLIDEWTGSIYGGLTVRERRLIKPVYGELDLSKPRTREATIEAVRQAVVLLRRLNETAGPNSVAAFLRARGVHIKRKQAEWLLQAARRRKKVA